MKDIKLQKEEINIKEIITFPFFKKLINNIKKYILILKIKKILLILEIIKKRKDSIKKIEKALREYKEIKKEKKKILIEEILKKRKEAINIIIKNYMNHSRWLKLHFMYKKSQGCYSIFPSINNVTNIKIKIYTNKYFSEHLTFPLNYCPYRHCFFIDIKKTKFIYNKIIRFHFIINKKIIVDSFYNSKKINGILVNEIDFREYDKRIEKNNKNIYEKIHGFDYLNDLDYSRKLSNDSNTKDNSFSLSDSDEENYNNLKEKKIMNSNYDLYNLNEDFSIKDNCQKKSRRISHESYDSNFKSILKNKFGIKSSDKLYKQNLRKKVSFGNVEYSY